MSQPVQSVYQPPERVLSVTGQALNMIPTTLSQVSLSVTVTAETAEAAQQEAAEKSTAVVAWLRSQNVDKLATAGISLYPQYDYIDDRQVPRGYQASNTLNFTLPTERAGEVIDGAIKAGATEISGVSFTAEEAVIVTARQRALELAVQDAQRQADTVLAALGLSRQEVINISIGSTYAPPPVPTDARIFSGADTAAKTPVIGQEQTINAEVTLHIRY